MILTERQEKLLEFVKEQHGQQVRKYTGEPYWHHLVSVAEIVSKWVPEGIEISLCHDLFEDTSCNSKLLIDTLYSLEYEQPEVIKIVNGTQDLTDVYVKKDYPMLNREERKLNEAHRLGMIPYISQSVKYADLIDNTNSIVKYDKGFAVKYLQEKIRVLDKMRNGHINLLVDCCWTLKNALTELHPLL